MLVAAVTYPQGSDGPSAHVLMLWESDSSVFGSGLIQVSVELKSMKPEQVDSEYASILFVLS